MGFNPGAPLLEVFEKDLVRQIAGKQLPVRFWQLFTAYYAVLIAFFLTFSIRRLRPVLKRGK